MVYAIAAPVESVDLEERKDIQTVKDFLKKEYLPGFRTLIETDTFPKGLSAEVVAAISAKKGEPAWMLEFRLRAYRKWLTMEEPKWSENHYPNFDYQSISYYSAPKNKKEYASLEDVPEELRKTFDKLGLPINEQKRLANVRQTATDYIWDSVSIATTFKEELAKAGVIFCSISEAVKDFPDLVRKHLGSVVRFSPLVHQ